MLKTIGKWLYLLGMLFAVIAALANLSTQLWVGIVLALIGIFVGIFLHLDDVVNYGIRFFLLKTVADVLNGIPTVGPYLTGIFGAVAAFLGPIVLTLLVVHFVKKYFFKK